jgi:hypothetical protein
VPGPTCQGSVHGGGLRGGCYQPAAPRRPGRTSLTGVPKPETRHTSLRPRNALLAAFLTRDDATKLEGSMIGTVAYCGFALANAGHDARRTKQEPEPDVQPGIAIDCRPSKR